MHHPRELDTHPKPPNHGDGNEHANGRNNFPLGLGALDLEGARFLYSVGARYAQPTVDKVFGNLADWFNHPPQPVGRMTEAETDRAIDRMTRIIEEAGKDNPGKRGLY